MDLILALDQSTSATKALLFEPSGRLVESESREHRQIYPKPAWVEHDPEEIWQNSLSLLRNLACRAQMRGHRLVCLSLCNQRETLVCFDRRSGKPLAPAIVWQCRRGEEICRRLEAEGAAPEVVERTGLRLDPYFTASKARWLVDSDACLAGKLETGEAVLGTIDSYLIHRLTKGAAFVTDHTNACRTLLYDIRTLSWSEDLCRLFHVSRKALPEIRESDAEMGRTDLDGALLEPLLIRGVMGDSQASLFGQRCFSEGAAKVTFGSGSSILLNLGHRDLRTSGGAVTTLAWVLGGKPTYSLEGIINYSAATISWLMSQLGLMNHASEAEILATSVPDSGGVFLVPGFTGLSAPYWRPEARGAILGLTPQSSRAHLVRAGLESIALQLGDVLDMMRESGAPVKAIYADGGPTVNGFLMQLSADLAGMEIHIAETPNGSPLGAALCGALGAGYFDSLEAISSLPREMRCISPARPSEKVESLREGWRRSIRAVLAHQNKSGPL